MMDTPQVVLITGASGGLGETVVKVFAATEARLALVARRIGPLQDLVAQLGLPAERVLCGAADLTDPEQAQEAVSAVLQRWGRVDCLLNLVGTWSGGVRVADLAVDQWRNMLATCLDSAFYISRAVLPAMVESGQGRIVHIGSRAVERPGTGQAAYNVAKAGLLALTRSIAADYGPQGIRANIILPSSIATERQRRSGSPAGSREGVSSDDLARMMLLLCSPAGDAFNGATIPMYGGMAV